MVRHGLICEMINSKCSSKWFCHGQMHGIIIPNGFAGKSKWFGTDEEYQFEFDGVVLTLHMILSSTRDENYY